MWYAPFVDPPRGSTTLGNARCTLWEFVLAIVGVLDAIVLAMSVFVLATRHVKLQPEPKPDTKGRTRRHNETSAMVVKPLQQW